MNFFLGLLRYSKLFPVYKIVHRVLLNSYSRLFQEANSSRTVLYFCTLNSSPIRPTCSSLDIVSMYDPSCLKTNCCRNVSIFSCHSYLQNCSQTITTVIFFSDCTAACVFTDNCNIHNSSLFTKLHARSLTIVHSEFFPVPKLNVHLIYSLDTLRSFQKNTH